MNVALGFRVHTGWATAVAVGGDAGSLVIVDRRRLELSDGSVPAQPYHAARQLPLDRAEELVGRAERVAGAMALRSLGELVRGLAESELVGAGLAIGSAAIPSSLPAILASHPLLHAAEGALYCSALAGAAAARGVPLVRVPARDLLVQSRTSLGRDEREIRELLAELGRAAGPPWRQDEREATMAACIALATG